jgi:transcription elongation factor Elf1
MGRKRRKIVKRTPRPFPTVFTCPLCGAMAVTVTHEKRSSTAVVACGSCKASEEITWYPAYSTVDAYTKWYDKVTGGGKAVETRQG